MIDKVLRYTKEHTWKVLMYGCFLLFFLVVVNVIIPDIRKIQIIKESIQEHRNKINLAYSKTDALYTLKRNKKKIWSEIQSIVNSQKKGKEISTVLNFISQAARKQNIEIQSLQVDEIIKTDNYIKLPLQCNVQGKFHPLSYFINSMENSDMIIDIKQISISSPNIALDELRIEMNIQVFYLGR